MTSISDQDIIAANDVISISKDAEQAFRKAADAVGNPELKKLFGEYSSQYAGFAKELQAGIDRLYLENKRSIEAAAHPHSGWTLMRGTLAERSERVILEDAEQAEDAIMARYQEAIARTALPDEIRMILGRQYEHVEANHSRIRELRDQAVR